MLMTWRYGRLANAKSLVAQEKPRPVCDVVMNGRLAHVKSYVAQDKAFQAPHITIRR